MSSSGYKRVWQPPVASTLSIRGTAATMGPGSDSFALRDFAYGPSATPSAPPVGDGAAPLRCGSATIQAPEADRLAWEAPAMTALTV